MVRSILNGLSVLLLSLPYVIHFRRLGDFPGPMWLCLFAEGTRLTPQKLEASQEYSRKNGLPVLQHHLQPRTRGFNHIIQNLEREK